MNARAKKILSLTLAILFLMQSMYPVLAAEGNGGENNNIKVIQPEVPIPEEPQGQVEFPQDETVLNNGTPSPSPPSRKLWRKRNRNFPLNFPRNRVKRHNLAKIYKMAKAKL